MLGRLLEKTGDTDAAFQAFSDAKKTEGQRFNPHAYAREIDALITGFSTAAMARLPRASQSSAQPVFIACMPRSGSTLVEQVLQAHRKPMALAKFRCCTRRWSTCRPSWA